MSNNIIKNVELLAPAGGYETMVGAFNAGADAVYLGGSRFGARAYADNFDTQQVIDAILYAHLHGKRIYMTVNTLVKEREFSEIYDFMRPFAENNLDGVIVQDYGVMRFIRKEFPNIELHASTQQTVTGVYGAKLLKELGCCRVVPARELSLMEMKAIREEADVEVEAFIHGAMCYCYSGACLFSSMLGTRSGNRGRCAQPCRLQYGLYGSKDKKELYPLSLKDMCTINIIPELIKAGIDSFKIEGRMKRPEYAAGVTSLYRKYIDMYYADPSKEINVSKDDMKILESLYLRTGISEGYYHQHNGRSMVTITSPAYNGTSEKVLGDIKDKYLSGPQKIKCRLECEAVIDEPLMLSMTVTGNNGKSIKEKIYGNIVTAASKRPMDEAGIRDKLGRLGNTQFETEDISVYIDDKGNSQGIFVPVSELNELRRRLVDNVTDKLLAVRCNKTDLANNELKENLSQESLYNKTTDKKGDYHILVNTSEQLKAALDFCDKNSENVRIYIDSDLFTSLDKKIANEKVELIVALPYITRREDFDGTADILNIIDTYKEKGVSGVLVRNLEQLGFIREHNFNGKVILDYGVYVWNHNSAELLKECNKTGSIDSNFTVDEISIPLELTIHEIKELVDAMDRNAGIPVSMNVYGRTPMMISAGCVKKTLDNCSGRLHKFNKENTAIVDRMGNVLPVTTNCRNCYNVIWNTIPTSLYKKMDSIKKYNKIDHFRIDFSIEDYNESANVLNAYIGDDDSKFVKEEQKGFTTGHYKRGVE